MTNFLSNAVNHTVRALKKTILVVDDDEEVRDLLSVVIQPTDTTIRFAGTLAEAKAIIEMQQVDVILLDIFLPDGNGLTFLSHWKDMRFSIERPCAIIMSAFPNWENYRKAFDLEAFSFLEKPFKVTRLRSLLEEALKKSSAPH